LEYSDCHQADIPYKAGPGVTILGCMLVKSPWGKYQEDWSTVTSPGRHSIQGRTRSDHTWVHDQEDWGTLTVTGWTIDKMQLVCGASGAYSLTLRTLRPRAPTLNFKISGPWSYKRKEMIFPVTNVNPRGGCLVTLYGYASLHVYHQGTDNIFLCMPCDTMCMPKCIVTPGPALEGMYAW